MKRLFLIFSAAYSLTGFSQTYFLQGDASFLGSDCYLLTPALNNQNGAVWYGDQLDLTQGFDLEFLMNFGSIDANGADGICFVMQNVGTSALGQSGGGLGFLGFSPAFGVEFDTWQNAKYGDPWFDHIAMISNGDVSHFSGNHIAGPVQASATNPNIEDGEDHIVRITWEPATFTMDVYFDCEFRLSAQIDLVNQLFSGQPLVYWGFTAATGGAVNNQSVCLQENILSTGPDAVICTGASIQLSAGGDPNGTFEWSPPDFLDDPLSQSPLCSAESSITYTVFYTDFCGNTQTSAVNVTVEDLEVTLSGPDELNCFSPTGTLSSLVNLPAPNTYSWSTVGGSFTTGTTAPSSVIESGGSYTVTVVHGGECTATATIVVGEDFDEPIVLIEGGELPLTCIEVTAPLSASSNASETSYQWTTVGGSISGNSNEAAIIALEAGTYTVAIVDLSNGCAGSDHVTVTSIVAYPTLSVGIADTLNCRVTEVPITGTSYAPDGAALVWTGPQGGIVGGAVEPVPVVRLEGWYVIEVTDETNGCRSSDSIYVHSDGALAIDFSSLTLPNIFTPNNDGINDRWFPVLGSDNAFNVMSYVTHYDLRLFNRWGTLVYDSEGVGQRWNGQDHAGNFLNEGVYFYILDLDVQCGTPPPQPMKGDLHLTR